MTKIFTARFARNKTKQISLETEKRNRFLFEILSKAEEIVTIWQQLFCICFSVNKFHSFSAMNFDLYVLGT